jgi:TolA-binding protein
VKKIIVIILCAAALSGCASMWNAMGAASADDVKAMKQSIDELSTMKSELDSAKVAAEEAKKSAAKVDEVAKSLAAIQGRLDTLTKETLQKLNDILDKAILELEAETASAAPADKPAAGK